MERSPTPLFDAPDEGALLAVASQVMGAPVVGKGVKAVVDGVPLQLEVVVPRQRRSGTSRYRYRITTPLAVPSFTLQLIQGRGMKLGAEQVRRPLPSGASTFSVWGKPLALAEAVFDDALLGRLEWIDAQAHPGILDFYNAGGTFVLHLGGTTDAAALRYLLETVALLARRVAEAAARLQAAGVDVRGDEAPSMTGGQLRRMLLIIAVVFALLFCGALGSAVAFVVAKVLGY